MPIHGKGGNGVFEAEKRRSREEKAGSKGAREPVCRTVNEGSLAKGTRIRDRVQRAGDGARWKVPGEDLPAGA